MKREVISIRRFVNNECEDNQRLCLRWFAGFCGWCLGLYSLWVGTCKDCDSYSLVYSLWLQDFQDLCKLSNPSGCRLKMISLNRHRSSSSYLYWNWVFEFGQKQIATLTELSNTVH
jgi:hypothetical protein